ncbi:hypothetical protein EVJ58_g7795 [Rhodofomes roseus]|uniref:Uncharacterized protein n=1 Tax=Rhodofomes roseus TaxID=34475 RepID=A0A4Y9Y425_9APHY|nr:hypothetical protein EVJ58_g7795 [Rhodofomes roseus]
MLQIEVYENELYNRRVQIRVPESNAKDKKADVRTAMQDRNPEMRRDERQYQ